MIQEFYFISYILFTNYRVKSGVSGSASYA